MQVISLFSGGAGPLAERELFEVSSKKTGRKYAKANLIIWLNERELQLCKFSCILNVKSRLGQLSIGLAVKREVW